MRVLLLLLLLFISYAWLFQDPFRQRINVSGGEILQDYQLKLVLNESNVGSNFDWNNNGNDLRFSYNETIYYVRINIYSEQAIQDYQLLLNITDERILGGIARKDAGDVRFFYTFTNNPYSEDGIPYWIERFDNRSLLVWIKVNLTAGNNDIYMYYGNSSAQSLSNGSKVFVFFDDDFLGWRKWRLGNVGRTKERYYSDTFYGLKKKDYCHPNGGYKDLGFTLDRNYWIVEFYRFRKEGEGTNCYADRTGVGDDFGRGYNVGWTHSSTSPSIYIDKMNGGTTTVLGRTYYSKDVIDRWYVAQLILMPDRLIARVLETNGDVVGETTVYDTTYTWFTRIYIEGGRPYYIGLVRIRKYVDSSITVSYSTPIILKTYEKEIPYWIESWNSIDRNASVWVKLPRIYGNITVYMYYGNDSLSSNSNFNSVFFGKIDGISRYWRLEGGDPNLDVISGVEAYLRGNAYYTSGYYGKGVHFDGYYDYIALNDYYQGSGTIDYITVCAWVKSSSSQRQIIISFDRSEYWRLALIDDTGTGNVGWDTAYPTEPIHDLGTQTSYADGHWHLICGSYNGDTGDKYIFVDGNIVASFTYARNGLGTGVKRYGFIGVGSEASSFDGNKGPNLWFNGLIDEVMIFNVNLDEPNVRKLFLYYPDVLSEFPNSLVLRTRPSDVSYVLGREELLEVPNIDFVPPTPENESYRNVNFVPINVTCGEGVSRVYIYLWNSTNVFQSVCTSCPCFYNFTQLSDGKYYFNATLVDTLGRENSTGDRWVVIDTNPPTLSVSSPTSGSTVTEKFSVTYQTSDENFAYVKISLISSGNPLYTFVFYGQGTKTVTLPVPSGTYDINVTSYDLAGNLNSILITSVRYVTSSRSASTLPFNLFSDLIKKFKR